MITFFESGTTTTKNTYDGPDTLTDNAITSLTLDSSGQGIAYGDGTYRIVVKDSDGSTIGTYDGMNFEVPVVTLNDVTSITSADSRG